MSTMSSLTYSLHKSKAKNVHVTAEKQEIVQSKVIFYKTCIAYRTENYLHIKYGATTGEFKFQFNNHMTQNRRQVACSARVCLN